jgi:3-dehydroquinate synthase
MIMAAEMSYKLGWIDLSLVQRIKTLLKAAGLPFDLKNSEVDPTPEYQANRKNLDRKAFIDLMNMDKKVANGELSLILLKGSLGNCIITNKYDNEVLNQVVDCYCRN